MGFEPTTSTLARLRSTPELHPLGWVSGPEPTAGEVYTPVAGKSNLYFGYFLIRIHPRSAELHQNAAYQ